MGKTLILAIDELAQGQVQAFTTVNDAIAALEESQNDVLAVTTTGDYTVAELDLVSYGVISFTGLTADATVTLPTTINTNNTKRVMWFKNDSTQYNITLTSGAGGNVSLPYETSRLVQIVGDTLTEIGKGGRPVDTPHTAAFFASGLPTHNTEVLRYVYAEPVDWSADVGGSQGSVRVDPNAASFFRISKNGTQVGQIRVSTAGAFVFTTISGSIISWAIGDVLSVQYVALEESTITLNSVPDTGDAIGINDGAGNTAVFTFGPVAGEVLPGADVTEGAINLVNAILGSTINPNVEATSNAGVVTVKSERTQQDASISKCETGLVTFGNVADAGDSITINDGVTSVQFDFVASGATNNQVNTGVNATESALNLETVIDASTLSSTIDVYRNGTALTIVNRLFAGGGSITKVDPDNDYTINDFSVDTNNSLSFTTFAGATTGEDYGVSLIGLRS